MDFTWIDDGNLKVNHGTTLDNGTIIPDEALPLSVDFFPRRKVTRFQSRGLATRNGRFVHQAEKYLFTMDGLNLHLRIFLMNWIHHELARRLCIFALGILIAAYLTGCSKRPSDSQKPADGSKPSSPQHSAPIGSSAGVFVNPLKMNPFPVFSKDAQTLKYPPGVDTIAYWGNGRFAVVGRFFYDFEKAGDKVIGREVQGFRYTNGVIYCKLSTDYVAVNLHSNTVQSFRKESVPMAFTTEIEKLEQRKEP